MLIMYVLAIADVTQKDATHKNSFVFDLLCQK